MSSPHSFVIHLKSRICSKLSRLERRGPCTGLSIVVNSEASKVGGTTPCQHCSISVDREGGWDPDGRIDPQGAQESTGVGDPDRDFIQIVQKGKEKREGTEGGGTVVCLSVLHRKKVIRSASNTALTFCLTSASVSPVLSWFISLTIEASPSSSRSCKAISLWSRDTPQGSWECLLGS